jgi:FkbM family methyltransferase
MNAPLSASPLELWSDGRSAEAIDAQRGAVRAALDLELLNDLAVMTAETGQTAGARAILRTIQAIDPGREDVEANLRRLDSDFTSAFLAGLAAHWADRVLDDHADVRPDYIRAEVMPNGEERLARSLHYLSQALLFAPLYTELDPRSREIMIRVLLFRALQRTRVPPPLDPQRYRDALRLADTLMVEPDMGRSDFFDWELKRFDLSPIGIPLQIISHEVGIATFFLLGQYRLNRDDVFVGVESGDVVIDGGACWGDTATYFAQLAGASGRVLALEFDPANIAMCERNLALNPEIAQRVTIVPNALWHVPGERMGYEPDGYGTTIALTQGTAAYTTTTTIDQLVIDHRLDRVDFIKLDIEGAEGNTLEGATDTIARFRPKLAIAAYHRNDDLHRLPAMIRRLDLGYRFHLDHYTTHHGETILYAQAA